MSDNIYSGTVTAKNGMQVPAFINGRTFFSTYNPDRDADNFIIAHKDAFADAGCILVGGIGNGLHLTKLAETYPGIRIIALKPTVNHSHLLKRFCLQISPMTFFSRQQMIFQKQS